MFYPLPPEELQGGVTVAEVVGAAQDPPALHRQPLPAENLQQGQESHAVLPGQ